MIATNYCEMSRKGAKICSSFVQIFRDFLLTNVRSFGIINKLSANAETRQKN